MSEVVNYVATTRRWYDRGNPRDAGDATPAGQAFGLFYITTDSKDSKDSKLSIREVLSLLSIGIKIKVYK